MKVNDIKYVFDHLVLCNILRRNLQRIIYYVLIIKKLKNRLNNWIQGMEILGNGDKNHFFV